MRLGGHLKNMVELSGWVARYASPMFVSRPRDSCWRSWWPFGRLANLNLNLPGTKAFLQLTELTQTLKGQLEIWPTTGLDWGKILPPIDFEEPSTYICQGKFEMVQGSIFKLRGWIEMWLLAGQLGSSPLGQECSRAEFRRTDNHEGIWSSGLTGIFIAQLWALNFFSNNSSVMLGG